MTQFWKRIQDRGRPKEETKYVTQKEFERFGKCWRLLSQNCRQEQPAGDKYGVMFCDQVTWKYPSRDGGQQISKKGSGKKYRQRVHLRTSQEHPGTRKIHREKMQNKQTIANHIITVCYLFFTCHGLMRDGITSRRQAGFRSTKENHLTTVRPGSVDESSKE